MSGTSRYEIDIIANNKASRALSKTNKQLQKIDQNAKKSNSALKTMGTLAASAAAALGSIKLAQSFMQTATQFENLNVQLKFITGNAKLGAQALDIVEAAASRSAFAMEDMAAAAPSLLTVSSVDELADTLDMAGDIAAATGMTFQEVSSQLQRAFSGGIAAADMFRERGVKAMLGFQEGVQYTAEETEKMIRDAFANGTTSLAGATAEMAKTWDGQISMMGDAWMQFKKTVMDSALFDALKDQLARVKGFLDDNREAIDTMARALGETLATGVTMLGDAVAFTVEHFEFFLTVAKGLIALKLASFITKAAGAMKVLNAVMRANPIGLVITAVASLIGYLSVKNGLGRTIVQVQAVLDSLGSAFATFGRFLSGKIGGMLDWVKEKFYDFVDSLIDAYNWLADLIPGMERFDKSAREVTSSLGEFAQDGLEYVKNKASDMGQALLDALPDEVAEAITGAAEAARLAGEEYDKYVEAAAKAALEQERLNEVVTHATVGQTALTNSTDSLTTATSGLNTELTTGKTAAEEWATQWTRLQEQLFPVQTRIAEINTLIGTLEEKIAAGEDKTGLMAQAVVKLRQELAQLDPVTQNVVASLQGYEDRIQRIARLEREAAGAKVELAQSAINLYDELHPLETQMKELNNDLKLAKEAYDAGVISGEKYAKIVSKIADKQEELRGVTKQTTDEIKKNTDETGKGFEDFADKFNKDFNKTLADGLVEGNLNFGSFADMWKNTLKELITDTLNGGSLLNDLLGWLGKALGGMFGGGGNIVGNVVDTQFARNAINPFSAFQSAGDFIGGHIARNFAFADGGHLGAGKQGLVGEAGPEIITGPATITPIEKIAGDKPAVNITIQAIDTQTGTEFLIKNKKQIEGIIQHAYNRRGKQGIY